VETTKQLTRDEDRHVRQALARALGLVRSTQGATILGQLLADPEPTVAAAAAEALFLMRKPIPAAKLMELIESREIDAKLAERLISLYPIVDRDSRSAVLALTKHRRSDFRAAALASMARLRGNLALDSASALAFLQDSSEKVRRGAQRILYANHDLTADQLTALIASPFVDVRQFVLSASRTIGRDAARDILYELLLDESTDVRRQAITEFARQRFTDAFDILKASLDDDSSEIKRAALTGLFQIGTQESVQVLQQFAKETQDEDLRAMVLSVLANRARRNRSRPTIPTRPSPVPQ
jgi:HEAT repeat protein